MRKLFSALAVVLVFAMAFTITASAAITGTQVYEPVGEKYTITAQDDRIKDAMVGMVVIEAAQDPETFTIDEDDIRYIDQTTAGTNGSISFPSFKPMDLKTDETMYLVYIGGGELQEATKIGKLASASEDPTPATYDVIFMADGAQVAKITKNVGETLAFADFPDVPAKTGYTGVWNVTTDITSATTVTAVYTEDSIGDDDDEPTILKGDIDGNGRVNSDDAISLLLYTFNSAMEIHANADVDGNNRVNSDDAIYLLLYTFNPSLPIN